MGGTAFVHSAERDNTSLLLHCSCYALLDKLHRIDLKGLTRHDKRGLLTVNHVAQLFPSLKEWHPFSRNLHGITGLGITPLAGIPVAYAKTPKATQLNFIPLA